MVLHTERTALRPLGPEHVRPMHALWTDPHVRKFLWDDVVITEDVAVEVLTASARDFERRGVGLWAMFDRSTDELIGFCGVRPNVDDVPELLYGLLPAACGRGLATEAARAVLAYVFDRLPVNEIVAATDVPNTASVRVMERLGMRFDRRAVQNGLDTLFYRITREEFDC